jgi:hypothetical protein
LLSLLLLDVSILLTEHIILLVRFHKLSSECIPGTFIQDVIEPAWVEIVEQTFQICTLVIVSIFLLELIFKLALYGIAYFRASYWNIFDAIIVIAAFTGEMIFGVIFAAGIALLVPLRLVRLIRLSYAIVEIDESRHNAHEKVDELKNELKIEVQDQDGAIEVVEMPADSTPRTSASFI